MRINVYAEEMTTEVVMVRKTSDTGIVFYGIRVFLESSKKLHHNVDDDDRSAITFWVKWTKKKGFDTSVLQQFALKILGQITIVDEQNDKGEG